MMYRFSYLRNKSCDGSELFYSFYFFIVKQYFPSGILPSYTKKKTPAFLKRTLIRLFDILLLPGKAQTKYLSLRKY